MLHLLEGLEIRTHFLEKGKSPAPGWILTHDLPVTRRALYRCATTTALLNLKLVSLVEEFGGPSSGQDLWCPLAPKRVSYGDYKW